MGSDQSVPSMFDLVSRKIHTGAGVYGESDIMQLPHTEVFEAAR